MTVEYVLILSLFVLAIMSVMTKGPQVAFKDYAPMLGARIEKQLATGEEFTGRQGKFYLNWSGDE